MKKGGEPNRGEFNSLQIKHSAIIRTRLKRRVFGILSLVVLAGRIARLRPPRKILLENALV